MSGPEKISCLMLVCMFDEIEYREYVRTISFEKSPPMYQSACQMDACSSSYDQLFSLARSLDRSIARASCIVRVQCNRAALLRNLLLVQYMVPPFALFSLVSSVQEEKRAGLDRLKKIFKAMMWIEDLISKNPTELDTRLCFAQIADCLNNP